MPSSVVFAIKLLWLFLTVAKMLSLDTFIDSPTVKALSSVTRDELVLISGHYKVEVGGSPAKADLLSRLIEVLTAQTNY